VGTEIALIEVEGAPSEQPANWQPPGQPESAAMTAAPEPEAVQAGAHETQAGPSEQVAGAVSTVPTRSASSDGQQSAAEPQERVRFSPAVRKLAQEHGIDPAVVPGTGLGGRVTRDDVLAFVAGAQTRAPAPATTAAAQPAAPPTLAAGDGAREELVRISAIRRSIADHMVRSLATSPHAWTLQEVDATALVRYREAQKEGFQQRNGVPLTYLPMIVQLLCESLREFPFLNSSWSEDGIVLKRYFNIGIAVSVPDGLIVPVVKDADKLGFTDLAHRLNDLVDRARNKQLKPEDVQGGTFTLNNTGPTGSVASQPIINQPQAAILTTESIVRRPVVIGDGIAIRHMMNMCLSFDHRVIDGMMAGQFLTSIRKRVEEWTPAAIRL
jgi:2-oxoisovalerate dehydrogenase E2 component (dihydrolipoyl transacylase)